MTGSYRYVRLLKNHLYPTYQLHAFMANSATSPEDGLRLAALTTIHWLKTRLGNAAPSEWDKIPSPENYLTAANEDLPSLYVNQGYVINIVSLPEKGMWTLQITEPALGSDPGNPDQKRQPVPGRIIETNIAYLISGSSVECGFKTVISDPEGTVPEAEVYRTTVVKLLMENPAFGLKQVTGIPMKTIRVTDASQVRKMLRITHHAENQLPAVIFTQIMEEHRSVPGSVDLSNLRFGTVFPSPAIDLKGLNLPPKSPILPKTEKSFYDPSYDLDKFAYYTFSHCRTYVLDNSANKSMTDQSGIRFKPGDIIVIYPSSLGGGERVIPYTPTDVSWDDTIEAVEKGVKDTLKTRDVDFGQIMFLSGVREHLLQMTDKLAEDAKRADSEFQSQIEQIKAFWKAELDQKNLELEAVSDRLRKQKEYASRLEDEKSIIREQSSAEQDKLREEITRHLETIAFLKRKNNQPDDYEGIPSWVSRHFPDRLTLHEKAVSRLLTRSCQCASVDLICDALDYLATDYWEMRYLQIPKEIILTRCAEKYCRPFDVKPVGQATIEFTPSEYRIKYFPDSQGRLCDSALDFHLRVGNDPENLLRIYFLHDDSRKRIVVGSLPDHLRSVKIQ